MNLENMIFKKTKPNYDKLLKYGFKKQENKYTYKIKFMNNEFEAQIIITDKVEGKIIDLDTKEEYTNIRLENIGAFASKVKKEYEEILKQIKENCFEKQYFMLPQSNRIAQYIIKKYNVEPEFLWEKLDGSAVFRNKETKKWFGIIMDINKNKIDKQNKLIEIINVKLDNKVIEELIKKEGYYKAYHMNKKSWITIILDDTLKDEEIIKYIDESYNIIKRR